MRLDKFTIKAQEALQAANKRAENLESAQLESEHLLVALLSQEDGLVAPLLRKLGVAMESLASELEQHLSAQPKVRGGQLTLSSALDAVFRTAEKEADQFKDEYISTEHLLLGLAASDGFAGKLLRRHGAGRSDILKVLASIRGSARVTDPNAEEKYQALKRYARDLTDLARKGSSIR